MRAIAFGIAAALSLWTAVGVRAESVRRLDTAIAAHRGAQGGGSPRGFSGAGFEESEGYSLGTCSGNNGWRAFGSSNPTPPGPRAPMTSVTGLQGNLGRSLLLDANPNFPTNTSIGCFSPQFMNPADPFLNVDLFRDDDFGADYEIIPQAPSQGLLSARVNFSYTGDIFVLDDTDGPGPGGLTFENTGVAWAAASWATLQIEMDVPNQRVGIWYGPDKNNLTNIYNAFMFGGTLIEEVVLFSDNFQSAGFGSFTGGPVGTYIDNVVLKPEPATLALLGLAGFLTLRRIRTRPASHRSAVAGAGRVA